MRMGSLRNVLATFNDESLIGQRSVCFRLEKGEVLDTLAAAGVAHPKVGFVLTFL